MHRKRLVASFGLVVGVASALSAQTPSSNDKVDQDAIQSIRVRVIGCVARGPAVGRYRLTNAVLSGDDLPSTTGTVGTAGSGKDVSFEDSPSYDLLGGHLEAHMGHKVEVVGITSDTKLNHSDAFSSAIGSSTRQKATLTVTSMKMMGATCP
jgi:hypothetical protein